MTKQLYLLNMGFDFSCFCSVENQRLVFCGIHWSCNTRISGKIIQNRSSASLHSPSFVVLSENSFDNRKQKSPATLLRVPQLPHRGGSLHETRNRSLSASNSASRVRKPAAAVLFQDDVCLITCATVFVFSFFL
jgi:hypothetical protein